ncbi:MAG: tetratricopeptide repeat protein [Planctomycetales bacterium]|nr:tetratricopeptide repeat protein [Planctomycetales bacterium]
MHTQMDAAQIQQNLQVAVSLQAAKKIPEAAEIYEAILQVNSAQPDALHLLGLIESQRGNHERAINLIQRATTILPENATFWSNFGVVLRYANRLREALAAYKHSLELAPNQADVHFNYGKSLKLAGDLKQAEFHFKQAIKLDPKKTSPWLSLMNLAADVGKPEISLALANSALEHNPENPDILLNAGILMKRESAFDQALVCFGRVLQKVPNHVEALCKIAAIEISRQQFDSARERLEQARKSEPENSHVLLTIGLLNNSLGDYARAAAALRRAIELYPENGAAHANLGIALKKQGLLSDALQMMQRGSELDPKSEETKINLAGVQVSLGRVQEAQKNFVEVLKSPKGNKDAHDSLLMCMQYDPNVSVEQIFGEHRKWDERYASRLKPTEQIARRNKTASGPIRLGFVSADLGRHPVGYFCVNLFEQIDREKFSLYVYSDRVGRDTVSNRIEKCSNWSDVGGLDDEQLTKKIRDDKIDMLFDLAGHTSQNRLLVFARRAAPVQISWAGYVGTTGLSEMDYVLGDKYHLPPGCESYFCEKLIRMPNDYVTYAMPDESPEVSPLPALKNGYVTFGAMCNPAKVNSLLLGIWQKVLAAVPESRIVFCYTGWNDVGNQSRVAAGLQLPMDSERLRFMRCDAPEEVMSVYQNVDIAIDTYPYSGGLTTCEAMWMGVPTITLPSDKFAGRHSLSHLSNVGLSQFIASDADDYVRRVKSLMEQLNTLNALRTNLRAKVQASPLCNATQFARDFEIQMLRVLDAH